MLQKRYKGGLQKAQTHGFVQVLKEIFWTETVYFKMILDVFLFSAGILLKQTATANCT